MKTVKTIFENNSHSVLIVDTDRGREVCHQAHNVTRQQFPIQYESGKIGYDFMPPKYIKPKIEQAFQRLNEEQVKQEYLNSTVSGTVVKAENCIVKVSDIDRVETIGLMLSEVNSKTDYAIYRLLGANWSKDKENKVIIESLISDDSLTVTGFEYDQWFNKREAEENQRIRAFWNKVQKALNNRKKN